MISQNTENSIITIDDGKALFMKDKELLAYNPSPKINITHNDNFTYKSLIGEIIIMSNIDFRTWIISQ
jgi:hypothetical protein